MGATDKLPNVFVKYSTDETPHERKIGQWKTCGYIVTFLIGIIILGVYYGTSEAVIKREIKKPTLSQYEEIEDFEPTCTCTNTLAVKFENFATLMWNQDTFCDSAFSNYETCEALAENCTEDIGLMKGIAKACEAGEVSMDSLKETFNATTYSMSQLDPSFEFEANIQDVADELQRRLEFGFFTILQLTDAIFTIDMPLLRGSSISNSTVCESTWDSQCSYFFGGLGDITMAYMANDTIWEEYSYINTYAGDVTVLKALQSGFAHWPNISVDFEAYFDACEPKECSYFVRSYRTAVEIITAISALIGGLNVLLKGIFGALPGPKEKNNANIENVQPAPVEPTTA